MVSAAELLRDILSLFDGKPHASIVMLHDECYVAADAGPLTVVCRIDGEIDRAAEKIATHVAMMADGALRAKMLGMVRAHREETGDTSPIDVRVVTINSNGTEVLVE